jgi:hypothetical protein
VIFFPETLEIGVMQDRVASPLMCTVHAPHNAIPQPNLVPVMFSVSRSTQSSGICGSTSTVVDFPFRVKVTAIFASLGLEKTSYTNPVYRWKCPKNRLPGRPPFTQS